jgi:putative membrane protein
MLEPVIVKNDKKARWIIAIFSFVVFSAVVIMGRVKLNVHPGFNVHIFAAINAAINSVVALLLVAALIAVKKKKYLLHKRIMLTALALSVIFLVSYIMHHLLAGEARFGDINHDGILSDEEKEAVGIKLRLIYYLILSTHIFLAAIILPFILFTAYRGLTAEFSLHKDIARVTWPMWLYVAITGPVVYWMISPYYR